ncbi:MAG: hypothetical protein ABI895_34120 [Deltaproteobacteria bacterium]
MKLLPTLSAVCLSLTAYTSAALAADTSAETATEATDPSVSGMLPGEKSDAPDASADKVVSSSRSTNDKGREAKNAIYLDLLGPGLLYSINYDREIIPDLAVRIGLSYMSIGASASDGAGTTTSAKFSYLAIPITASYLGIGSTSNMLELGGGPVILNFSGSGLVESSDEDVSGGASATTLALTGMAGYRHQPADGGFVFRIGASPMMVLGANVLPWGYMSLGAAF